MGHCSDDLLTEVQKKQIGIYKQSSALRSASAVKTFTTVCSLPPLRAWICKPSRCAAACGHLSFDPKSFSSFSIFLYLALGARSRDPQLVTMPCLDSGNERMRLPVAAKIALSTAGAATAIVGSPTPPQKPPLGITIDSTCGIAAMRIDG